MHIGWTKSPIDWVKCNTDRALKGLRTSSGGTIHDADENWICGFSFNADIGTILGAELMAIWQELEFGQGDAIEQGDFRNG